jgi:hypothetical protein
MATSAPVIAAMAKCCSTLASMSKFKPKNSRPQEQEMGEVLKLIL